MSAQSNKILHGIIKLGESFTGSTTPPAYMAEILGHKCRRAICLR